MLDHADPALALPGHDAFAPRADVAFVSHVDGLRLTAHGLDERGTGILRLEGAGRSRWAVQAEGGRLALAAGAIADADPGSHLLGALDAVFARHAGAASLALSADPALLAPLADAGVVELDERGAAVAHRDALWQQPRLWVPPEAARPAFALRHQMTQGRRHPRRPARHSGVVYRRHIPWLGRTLALRAIDREADLPAFNRWMNEAAVARFWQEEGDLQKHRAYLAGIAADAHVQGLVMTLDDDAFGYVEAYWAREDRIAPFCDAADHDRGWHVLVGDPLRRGREFLAAWMPSVSHWLFLDDCRTQRLVIEPRIDNDRMIRSLARCGYALVKSFSFPHKRAMLGTLARERFFDEALWLPRPGSRLGEQAAPSAR